MLACTTPYQQHKIMVLEKDETFSLKLNNQFGSLLARAIRLSVFQERISDPLQNFQPATRTARQVRSSLIPSGTATFNIGL